MSPRASTAIHALVERCRTAHHASLVARLDSGWVVMAERQVRRGYCLLLPDPVVAHLNALSLAARAAFLADMALVGDALLASSGALRINYAMFGNLEPALHAHIIPRYREEPESEREAQPWALDWARAPAYDESAHGALRAQLAAYLQGRARAR